MFKELIPLTHKGEFIGSVTFPNNDANEARIGVGFPSGFPAASRRLFYADYVNGLPTQMCVTLAKESISDLLAEQPINITNLLYLIQSFSDSEGSMSLNDLHDQYQDMESYLKAEIEGGAMTADQLPQIRKIAQATTTRFYSQIPDSDQGHSKTILNKINWDNRIFMEVAIEIINKDPKGDSLIQESSQDKLLETLEVRAIRELITNTPRVDIDQLVISPNPKNPSIFYHERWRRLSNAISDNTDGIEEGQATWGQGIIAGDKVCVVSRGKEMLTASLTRKVGSVSIPIWTDARIPAVLTPALMQEFRHERPEARRVNSLIQVNPPQPFKPPSQ